MFSHVHALTNIHFLSVLKGGPSLLTSPPVTFLGSQNEGVLRGFTVAVFSPILSIVIWMISMRLACFLCVHVSEFTYPIFTQSFFFFVGEEARARRPLQHVFCLRLYVLCARSLWFVFVFLATRGPS